MTIPFRIELEGDVFLCQGCGEFKPDPEYPGDPSTPDCWACRQEKLFKMEVDA